MMYRKMRNTRSTNKIEKGFGTFTEIKFDYYLRCD